MKNPPDQMTEFFDFGQDLARARNPILDLVGLNAQDTTTGSFADSSGSTTGREIAAIVLIGAGMQVVGSALGAAPNPAIKAVGAVIRIAGTGVSTLGTGVALSR